MKNLHVKVIVNGESIDKKLKAFTERGLKRKAKAFYNKNEKILSQCSFCKVLLCI